MTPSPSPVAAVLGELEGLLAKATPGEWSRWDAPDCTAVAAQVRYTHGVPSNPLFWVGSQMTYRDAELIVAMHTHLPRLLAAIRAADELHTPRTCSCGGRRWVKDENWSPRDYERGREREEGAGLVPCGFCNHGGWNTEQWDVDGAVSCEQCDFIWPCDTATALRSALAAVDVAEATE